ncbi:MAG TPA: pyruvate kinase [Candidatus Paceibacterota bacterium]
MDIHRKSKIVAKIADNKSEVPFLKMVIDAGVDVLWLNTAHQDEPEALELVKRIRSVSTRHPIMIDTKGPEIRTKNIETPFEVTTGDEIIFTGDLSYTGKNVVQVSYPNFHNEVPVGAFVLYDDASIETVVTEKVKNGIKCVVKGKGLIKNKKSLNIPDVRIELPSLTDKDIRFLHFCAQNKIDYIAHSFVRNKADLKAIYDVLKEYPEYEPKIMAKIENREGFNKLGEILDNCHAIMVARGDLGAEVLMEELPYMQKRMVTQALEKGKPVIVATQALDSMIKNPRPTRAEVTDVANAILDGACGVSLSGETAYGDYPKEAVEMMARVMKYTEAKRDDLTHFSATPAAKGKTGKMLKQAQSIIKAATKAKAQAIMVASTNVELSKAIACYRPTVPVLALGLEAHDAREVMFTYAIRPILKSEVETLDFKNGAPMIVVMEKGKDKFAVSKVKYQKTPKFLATFAKAPSKE